MLMMDQAAEGNREELRRKLRENFDGRIVRKDLTKKIKEGANVPVYVLEFLLGQYCSSDDEEIIEQGVQNVKHILADNFVRPDEAQKVLSQLRRNGSHTIIDSGAKKVLLPISSAADLGTVPPELVGSFNLIFYSSAEDAVFKALGVE